MNLARSDDYQDGNGNRVHSAYEHWNTSLQTGWTPSEQHRVNVSLGLSDGEAAYADRGMDGSRFRRESTALGYRGTDLTDWLQQVEAQYFYNYVDHVMDNFSLRQFTPGMMMNPAASNPDRRTHGGRIRSRLALSDAVELELGIDGQSNTHRARMSMNQSLMPVQEMARRTDAQMSQWGSFGQLRYTLTEQYAVIGGVRADRWQAKDLRTTMTATIDREQSQASTRRQTLWGRELQTSISVFYADISDYILLQAGTHDQPDLVRNVDVHHFGLELDNQYDFNLHWQGQASLAYSKGVNRSDDGPLAQQPPLELKLGLNWRYQSLQVGGLLRTAARQHRVALNQGTIAGVDTGPTAGFTTVSINASWQQFNGMHWSFGIDNVFDKAYAEHLNRGGVMISGYLPQTQIMEPGRTLWANWTYQW